MALTARSRSSVWIIGVQPVEDGLHLVSSDYRRIENKGKLGRALQPNLTPDRTLETYALLRQRVVNAFLAAGVVHGRMAQVGLNVDGGDRDQRQPLVVIGHPLERLGHDFAQDLVDAGGTRVTPRTRPVRHRARATADGQRAPRSRD